ncbi:autoinducer binding domain-containing protein [Bartonella sp. LJL80]
MHNQELKFFKSKFNGRTNVISALETAAEVIEPLGYRACSYEFIPDMTNCKNFFKRPEIFEIYQGPDEFKTLWLENGLYQYDPLLNLKIYRNMPFAWSFKEQSVVTPYAQIGQAKLVANYFLQIGFELGVSVPYHLPNGGLLVFTVYKTYADSMDLQHAEKDRTYLMGVAHIIFNAMDPIYLGLNNKCELAQTKEKHKNNMSAFKQLSFSISFESL